MASPATGHRAPRPLTGRSWWRLAPPLVVVILVAGAAIERGNGFDSADAASVTSIATDAFSRNDASGLGSADVGGPYRTSSNATSFRPTVDGGAALLPIAPGKHSEIWLPDVVGDHADMRVEFRVPELPAAGSGIYVGIDLRKQADGDTNRVRVRVDPRGVAHLGFTRVRNDVEVGLGRERTVPGRVAAGQTLVLEGRVGGGVDVSLIARLYQPGATVPDWQAGVVDTDDQRISTRGGVGVWAYLTRRAADSTTIAVDALDAFEVSGDDGDNDVPPLPPVGTDDRAGAVPDVVARPVVQPADELELDDLTEHDPAHHDAAPDEHAAHPAAAARRRPGRLPDTRGGGVPGALVRRRLRGPRRQRLRRR